MKTFLTIEAADAWGISMQEARRFTDAEKSRFAEWYREIGMVGIGDCIGLDHLKWSDMPKRPADGEFCGCSNRAWIITRAEWDAYIALNARRAEEKRARQEAAKRAAMQHIIEKAQRQGGAYTPEDARARAEAWINAVNEGGEGYVPEYITTADVECAEKWLSAHPQ